MTKGFPGGVTSIDVLPGEVFGYRIAYSCSAVTQGANCEEATIVDALPMPLEFVSAVAGPGVAVVYVDGTRTVTVTFPGGINPSTDGLKAGTTGILTLNVRFPPGTLSTPQNANIVNIATIFDINSSDSSDDEPTDVTVSPGTFSMSTFKSVQDDGVAGVINVPPGLFFTTAYAVQVCANNSVGGINLVNAGMVDQLPPTATFVSASHGGVFNPATHTVTWTAQSAGGGLPNLIQAGTCHTATLVVEYDPAGPDGQPGTGDEPVAGQIATNQLRASGSGEDGSGPVTVGPVTAPLELRLPSYASAITKSADSPSSYTGEGVQELPGGPVTFTVNLENTGSVTLTGVSIVDTIPAGHTITGVGIRPAGTTPAAGFYQTSLNGSWQAFPGNPYAAPATVAVVNTPTATPNDIELQPGEFITFLRWDLGDISVGAAPWTVDIVAVLDPAFTPGDATDPNCVDMSLTAFNPAGGLLEPQTETACAPAIGIIAPRSIPRPVKSVAGDFFPGEVVDYELRFANAGPAHLPIAAPIMLADIVPPQLEIVVEDPVASGLYRVATPADAWYEFSSNLPGTVGPDVVTLDPAYNPDGDSIIETLARWEWTDSGFSLAPGVELVVAFQARIKDGTPPGPVQNRASILYPTDQNNPLPCSGGDGNYAFVDEYDLNGDGHADDIGCQTGGRSIGVLEFLRMDSVKFVKGELDADWNQDGVTVLGGDIDYRLVLTNSSNVSVTNVIIYDILPFVGDTGNIDLTSRLSQWRPNLQGPVTIPPGTKATVEYSESGEPCRPELIPALKPPACVDDWSTTPPDDITSVQAIRIKFCDNTGCEVLGPDDGSGNGGALEFTFPMAAPPDAPLAPARAWNSFGFTATDENDSIKLTPAEPNKVGIRLQEPTGLSLGNFVWLDVAGLQNDGIQQPTEAGISGVRVELWDAGTNTLLDYRLTGPNNAGEHGYYLFSDLAPGNYFLRFFPPTGFTPSPANQGSDALDSDGQPVVSQPYLQTAVIALIADDLTWDQGLWLPTDYGDAPNGYATNAAYLQANAGDPANAARHIIAPGLYLGSTVDAELDGQPTANALGDDLGTPDDDEDGVSFAQIIGTAAQPSALMVIGQQSTINLSAAVPADETGYLNAWIDWAGDGWDASDQIATDLARTASGSFSINVTPPTATAQPGVTYARFRFSTQNGLGPTGTALDGEVEDYQIQLLTAPTKVLVATSESHTGPVSGTERVAIGEVFRFRLAMQLPEGTTTDYQFLDLLPTGLQFLNDGTARVALVANGTGVTSSLVNSGLPNCSNLNVTGAGSAVTPSCPLPDAAVSTSATSNADSYGDGTDVYFKLGTVVNLDNDTDSEFVVIEFNAVVRNQTNAQANAQRNNQGRVRINGATLADTNTVNARVAEPVITNLAKSVTTVPVDAGDPIVYRITYGNTASGANAAAAFDLVLVDTLNANIVPTAQSVNATGGTCGATAQSSAVVVSGQTVTATVSCLNPGGNVTVIITGTVAAATPVGQTLPNTAALTYTSLPAANGTTSNSTGSATPGSPGATTGERTGADGVGGLNDYAGSSSTSTVLAGPTIAKSLVATSAAHTAGTNVTIGEVITYSLQVIVPEGVATPLVVTDVLPPGLAYVGNSVTVDASGFGGTLPTPTVTPPGDGNPGDDVTITFASVTVTPDNNPANNDFTIRLRARVADVASNVGLSPAQTVLPNQAGVSAGGGATVNSNTINTTVVEPRMTLVKSLSPLRAAPNETVTVTLTLANSGAADAFDVTLADLLPAGMNFVAGSLDCTLGAQDPVTCTESNGTVGATWTTFTVAGGNAIVRFRVTVAANATSGQTIANTATVTQATTLPGNAPGERAEPNVSGSATLTVITPDLVLSKDDGQTSVRPDEVLVYDLVVTNVGEAEAVNVVITDTVPAHTTFVVADSTSGWSCVDGAPAGTACTFALASLAGNGTSTTIKFAVRTAASLPVTQIVNAAEVRDDGSRGADPTPANNEDDDTNFLTRLGDLVWYDRNNDGIQQLNEEPGIADVTLELLAGNSVVATTTTDASGVYTFYVTGGTVYSVRIAPSEFGPGQPLANWTASPQNVGNDAADSDADPATKTIGGINVPAGTADITRDFGLSIQSSLQVEKVLNGIDPFRPGDSFDFTVRITNTGQTTLTVVPLVDQYPDAFLFFVSANPAPDDQSTIGQVRWFDLTASGPTGLGRDLAPGDPPLEVTLSFVGKRDTTVVGVNGVVNRVSVVAQFDPDGSGPLPTEALPAVDAQANVRLLSPTSADLMRSALRYRNGAVDITWTTAAESDIAHFNLMRWDGNALILLNSEPIVAKASGQPIGADYLFSDESVTFGDQYGYLLEISAVDGAVRQVYIGTTTASWRAYLPAILGQ